MREYEVERKWLLKAFPTSYLCTLENVTTLNLTYVYEGNVRYSWQTDVNDDTVPGSYKKTIKSPPNLSRIEFSEYISISEFENKWRTPGNSRIEKLRYLVPYKDCVFEIDVYDRLDIVTLEIEKIFSYDDPFLKEKTHKFKNEIIDFGHLHKFVLYEITGIPEFYTQNLSID